MNNFNNFNPNNQMKINPAMFAQNRTSSALKFLISICLGMIPFILCSLFIFAEGMIGDFHQWGENGIPGNFNNYIVVSYGVMWLIGLLVYVAIIGITYALTIFVKDIKGDVIPPVSAMAVAMLNMFVIPHTSIYFLLLSLPAFAIIGYILGALIMVFVFIGNLKKQMLKMQEDPQMKKMMDELQSKAKQQNNDIKNNPFVDVKAEDEEKEDKE